MRVENFRLNSDNVQHFAVLIILTNSGTHTGVLYRLSGELYVVDQCWHLCFRCKPADRPMACVVPDLLEEEFQSIVAVCELFVRRTLRAGIPRIPMGFAQPKNVTFSADGEVVWDGSVGLTCATFVLSIFEAAKIPLVELSRWRRRSGDDARHEELLLLLERGDASNGIPKASQDHIARVRAELPAIRVRPEEVAGAAMHPVRPVGFELAEQAGLWILDRLKSREVP